jgi:hypothetical protein
VRHSLIPDVAPWTAFRSDAKPVIKTKVRIIAIAVIRRCRAGGLS